MRILLTNDDGIHAPGLLAMWRELKQMGEVHVVAPETVQSATGHGITLTGPLMTSRVRIEGGFEGIAVDGRPADCVKLAISHLLPDRPDLVISGINSGVNVGINVIYSGTVAAAIEGAFLGLPSIAVSLFLKREIDADYAQAARFSRRTIEQILQAGLAPGQVATINLPALASGQSPKGTRVVRQSTQAWTDEYDRRTNPRGQDYFWNKTIFALVDTESDTDTAAIKQEYITITPLQFDLTDHAMLKKWQQRDWR